MGNVNNCLSNPYEYEVIQIRPEKNITTDKTFNNYNSKNISSKYYLYNPNLDIINEEDIQETNSQNEKQPRDRYLYSSSSQNISNKYNTNDNNSLRRNNIQGIKIRDNNILFNSNRKNNINENNDENYNYNINEKNNELQINNNKSENNYETNKYITSLGESDNLIVLDYNKPEGTNNNQNININNIKNYNNNDDLTPKEKNMSNNNNVHRKDKDNLIQNLIQKNINQFNNNIPFKEIKKTKI